MSSGDIVPDRMITPFRERCCGTQSSGGWPSTKSAPCNAAAVQPVKTASGYAGVRASRTSWTVGGPSPMRRIPWITEADVARTAYSVSWGMRSRVRRNILIGRTRAAIGSLSARFTAVSVASSCGFVTETAVNLPPEIRRPMQ